MRHGRHALPCFFPSVPLSWVLNEVSKQFQPKAYTVRQSPANQWNFSHRDLTTRNRNNRGSPSFPPHARVHTCRSGSLYRVPRLGSFSDLLLLVKQHLYKYLATLRHSGEKQKYFPWIPRVSHPFTPKNVFFPPMSQSTNQKTTKAKSPESVRARAHESKKKKKTADLLYTSAGQQTRA